MGNATFTGLPQGTKNTDKKKDREREKYCFKVRLKKNIYRMNNKYTKRGKQ